MKKTTTMFAALTSILAMHTDTGGLNQLFSVEPMDAENASDFCGSVAQDSMTPELATDFVDLQMGHDCLGIFMVIGGVEAVLGYIVMRCDNEGAPVRAWWSI